MNKLATVSNAPQTAAKPAQAPSLAAALQTAKPAHAAEANTQGKTFGDVLARHVSEAKPVESAPQPKKVSNKAVEKKEDGAAQVKKVSNNAAEKADMETSQSGKVSDSVAEKADADTAPAKKVSDSATDKTEDQAATALPSDAAAKASPDMLATLIPLNAAAAQSATVSQDAPVSQDAVAAQAAAQGVAMAQGAAAAQSAPAIRTASTAQDASADQAAPGTQGMLTGAKNSMSADQVIHSAGNNAQARNAPAVDAKKDAAFSNMMESLTAATAAKLSNNDEKGAALAAAPQASAVAEAAMQAATAPAAPANVLPTQVTINTPVSHEKWGDEFNQKITWLSSQKEQTAELHLNPPQLGPMDVVLKVSGDQATALFTSPHAAVREAVEQAMPRLREMLAESGIMLGNATVSDQAPRNRQDNQENKSSNSRSSIGGISDSTMAGSLNARVTQINRHNGIVDTFA